MAYKHFLVTRFNVKNRDWNIDKNKKPVQNYEWLENRFQLFEQFCFPSIQSNQHSSEFNWIVFFDKNTPTEFLLRINQYEVIFKYFKPIFIDDMDQLTVAFRKEISKSLNNDTKFIITTRIDNDDSLNKDAMCLIQTFAEKNNIQSGIIDMTRGYCMQIKPNFEIRSCIHYSSPFISYVEPYKGFEKLQTVMSRPHHKWFYRVDTFEINNKPLWIQLIHKSNIANQMQGWLELNDDILSEFKLNFKLSYSLYSTRQRIYIFIINCLNYPFYRLKKISKKLLLKFEARFNK